MLCADPSHLEVFIVNNGDFPYYGLGDLELVVEFAEYCLKPDEPSSVPPVDALPSAPIAPGMFADISSQVIDILGFDVMALGMEDCRPGESGSIYLLALSCNSLMSDRLPQFVILS